MNNITRTIFIILFELVFTGLALMAQLFATVFWFGDHNEYPGPLGNNRFLILTLMVASFIVQFFLIWVLVRLFRKIGADQAVINRLRRLNFVMIAIIQIPLLLAFITDRT